MTIDDAVNKTVMLIIFSSDGLDAAGIKEKKFYAKIVGRDSIGLWIENPKLETTRVRDDNGAIIPPDRRQLEEHVAHVLIPWGIWGFMAPLAEFGVGWFFGGFIRAFLSMFMVGLGATIFTASSAGVSGVILSFTAARIFG